MNTHQGERRQVVVECDAFRPVRFGVAAAAVRIQLTQMNVVEPMTSPAVGRQSVLHRRLVTGNASQVGVCTPQRITRVRMNKQGIRPDRGLMTTVALIAVSALVIVIRKMAACAC